MQHSFALHPDGQTSLKFIAGLFAFFGEHFLQQFILLQCFLFSILKHLHFLSQEQFADTLALFRLDLQQEFEQHSLANNGKAIKAKMKATIIFFIF